MFLERYGYKTNEQFLDYEFSSTGPNGTVLKVVHYMQVGSSLFNLAFGDFEEATGDINDHVVTNNNDSRKVLSTVAATVHDFTLLYPGAWIMARGSTTARNRLYRMGISNHWEDIKETFRVLGLKGTRWEPFEKGGDYTAFLVRRK